MGCCALNGEVAIVVTWGEFSQHEPDLAAYGWELLTEELGYAYLGTCQPNGAPRVHPVLPFVAEGQLLVSVVATSPKVADLRHEPRYMLHATVGDNDTEFAVRGRAREITSDAVQARLIENQELNRVDLSGDCVVFALDVERVDAAIWDDGPPRRQTWRAEPRPEEVPAAANGMSTTPAAVSWARTSAIWRALNRSR